MYILALVIIICFLIIYNWYVVNELMSGAWCATDEFLDANGLSDFFLHIDNGLGNPTFKIVAITDDIDIIEGTIRFIYYTPLTYLIVSGGSGWVFIEENKYLDSGKFMFNPFLGELKFYGENSVTDFVRL